MRKTVFPLAAFALLALLAFSPAALAAGPVHKVTVSGEHGNLVGKIEEDAPRTYSFTGSFTLAAASKPRFASGGFKLVLVFYRDGVKVDEVQTPMRQVGSMYVTERFHFRLCCEFTRVGYELR
ncbi:hypothetical protein NNJEOMEG_00255 [Fundidesulfovibrio magnetotacticus]|uniref:Uncharacterized protein n=1 Tax=Fundidesulfovibrio magnetotacticus TaxID=2730080 RepID=A0A6V8LN48_9BACT|nr:hypothetical protein [Fundidesulfovibrio magnetotacticus]GFK92430.1 hypothetical protein NNJEOMEG_00255 [Fundidesulfovibrio magnetotacticus]